MDVDDIDSIVDQMSTTICGLQNWRTCRAFRSLLADFACIPRMMEQLLKYVRNQTLDGTKLSNIDFGRLYYELLNSFPLRIPDNFVVTILADIFLERHVLRADFVRSGAELRDGRRYTYGNLESLGLIALATMPEGNLIVQMPLALFRLHVNTLDASDPLTMCLNKVCNLIPLDLNDAFSCFRSQSFEDFHCNIEAIREMLLARRQCSEEIKCSVSQFYCLANLYNNMDYDMTLRSHVPVIEATNRIEDWNKDDFFVGNTNYVKNAAGAAFDSFTLREFNRGGDKVLFCGQQKLNSSQCLTNEQIIAEASKVAARLANAPYLLVIFANKVEAGASLSSMPDNCCIVTGKGWNKFYSSLFVARAHLVYEATKVNINTASKSELMTVDGIGSTFADRIIRNRLDRSFHDWSDVVKRVRNIPAKTACYFTYLYDMI